jgi:hypothetical protein
MPPRAGLRCLPAELRLPEVALHFLVVLACLSTVPTTAVTTRSLLQRGFEAKDQPARVVGTSPASDATEAVDVFEVQELMDRVAEGRRSIVLRNHLRVEEMAAWSGLKPAKALSIQVPTCSHTSHMSSGPHIITCPRAYAPSSSVAVHLIRNECWDTFLEHPSKA